MGSEYTETAQRCVQGFPRDYGQGKERGSETERRKERASVCHSLLSLLLLSYLGQSAPKVQQSAAMQKHPHSCLFHSSQYKGCLPKLNLQHMHLHKFASPALPPLPHQPPHPPHTHTPQLPFLHTPLKVTFFHKLLLQ